MRRWLFLLILILAGCDLNQNPAQPLVVVATAPAPDAGFSTYEHPSGVFSIRIPPGWIPDQLPDQNGLRVQFTAIEEAARVVRLTIYVVNTGQPLTAEAFAQAVNAYQPPPDVAAIPWKPTSDPTAMTDGSVRLTGIRAYPLLGDRALNIFMQGNGSYFSVIEVDLTQASADQLQILMAAANTYQVNPNAVMNVGQVEAAGLTSESGVIAFRSYTYWQDSQGGFNITGEVLNLTNDPFEAVRLTAYLFDSDGNQLAERSDLIPYDVIGGNEAAPFRIRFDTGRPSTAVRYEIHAAARSAAFTLQTFYGSSNFIISQDSAGYKSGFLTVSGVVQNIGPKLTTNIKVIVTIKNSQDQVVATEASFLTQAQLLPGETAPFEVTLYDLGGEPLYYNIMVQGHAQ
jgi:hypothetical protein